MAAVKGAPKGSTNEWIIGLFILVLYSPLIWIRSLASFGKLFIFAVTLIAIAVLSVSSYAIEQLEDRDWV